MDRKHYLRPHSFQRIGWALLIAFSILFGLVLWSINGAELIQQLIPPKYHLYVAWFLYIVAALSALFVGLSEEKQEDEFIQTLRLRSVANTAWICFTLMMGSILLWNLFSVFNAPWTTTLYEVSRMFNSLILAFFIYIAIFRFRLFKYRKEANHEE